MKPHTAVFACACIEILIMGAMPSAEALGQADRPKQLSRFLFEEAEVQLQRQRCTGVGNAQVMYAAAEVMVQQYQELKDLEEPLKGLVAAVSKTARDQVCSSVSTILVPRGGSTLPVVRETLGGGSGRVRTQYGMPELVLATLYMLPQKRNEYLAAVSPETKDAIETWKLANPAKYADLSRALQAPPFDLDADKWGNLRGYKMLDGSGSWILPKDGKLEGISTGTGLTN